MKRLFYLSIVFILSIYFVSPSISATIEDLEKKIDILADEIDEMKMGPELDQEKKIHFHGYGELHYNAQENGINEMDLHRLVLGMSYDFNDWIKLHTEVDYEHGFTEPEVEFAFVDFLFSDMFNVKAGYLLMPFGYLNEFHEPPLFYSVERPYVQKYLIPTTWGEGGVGIYGSLSERLKYQLYAVSSLDAGKFRDIDGIRKGRGKAAEAKSQDIAGILRLSYAAFSGLNVGGSFYTGNAAQDNATLDSANVTMFEGDFQFKKFGIELTGLYTQTNIDEAGKISALTGMTVGEKQIGWYLEGAYHLLDFINPGAEDDVVAFVRHEEFNTQDKVASGFTADPKYDRQVTTIGASYMPIPDIALKIDYELWDDASSVERSDQLNLGVAWMF